MSNMQVSNVLPVPDDVMEVEEFFREKSVFITGASGFMGKVLIEKLLWSCNNIGNVYILLRSKRGKDVNQRMKEILNLVIFDRIREKDPKLLDKIIPVEGDARELNLGLSNDDVRLLEDNVAVIFHFAATVRFTESLKTAILLNVRGTREVVNIARNMKNLKALVHVSTMYANTDKPVIEEKVYTKNSDWRMFINIAETLDENMINPLQDKILGCQPNSYTFTKFLAENVVNEYRNEVPTIIFRPSIVSCCMKDPLPGWVDNFNGPSGIWIAIITGVLHIAHAKGSGIQDYIPCDFCANALIISACHRGNSRIKECFTINAASGENKSINPSYLFDMAYTALDKIPLEKMLWEPAFYTTENKYLYMFLVLILHILPGLFFEALLKIARVDFSILSVYRKIFIVNMILKHFMLNQWTIITNNYCLLNSYIHPKNKKEFPIDMKSVNNLEATYIGLTGFKRFILKEEFTEEALNRARNHLRRMRLANFIFKGLVFTLLFWMAFTVLKYASRKMGEILLEV